MMDIHPERSSLEELDLMRDDDPQSTRRGIKLVLALFVFIVAGAAASSCEAAQANDPNECMTFADYGITARALIVAEVALQKRLEILGLMYTLDEERLVELGRIVRLAAEKSDKTPSDFAINVYQTCLKHAGDISVLLGPAS